MRSGRQERCECDPFVTYRSDGNNTPQELIDRAVRLGMKAIAITDRDIVPSRRSNGERPNG